MLLGELFLFCMESEQACMLLGELFSRLAVRALQSPEHA